MDTRLERLEEKVDKVAENLGEVKVTMAQNTVQLEANTKSLDEHKAQTLEVRKQTQMLFEALQKMDETNQTRIQPLEKFVDRAKWSGILLGTFGTVVLGAHELGLFRLLQAFLQK